MLQRGDKLYRGDNASESNCWTNDEVNLLHGIKTESSPFLENILAFVGLYFYNVKILSKSVLWVHR